MLLNEVRLPDKFSCVSGMLWCNINKFKWNVLGMRGCRSEAVNVEVLNLQRFMLALSWARRVDRIEYQCQTATLCGKRNSCSPATSTSSSLPGIRVGWWLSTRGWSAATGIWALGINSSCFEFWLPRRRLNVSSRGMMRWQWRVSMRLGARKMWGRLGWGAGKIRIMIIIRTPNEMQWNVR